MAIISFNAVQTKDRKRHVRAHIRFFTISGKVSNALRQFQYLSISIVFEQLKCLLKKFNNSYDAADRKKYEIWGIIEFAKKCKVA